MKHGLAANAAGVSIGAVLAGLAALRRGKSVHPKGVVHEARLVVTGAPAAPAGAKLLSEPGEHRAIVRFSRSLGVPRPLPDLLGISIRVPDAYGTAQHQDMLFVTSADLPIVHRIFLPATDLQQRPYSGSLPYRSGGDKYILGVLPDGPDRFKLAVAAPMGRFQPVADLLIGERLTDELDALRFNPWNTGGGMDPVGVLNGARDVAYKLSQSAWGRALPGAAEAADRRLAEL